MGVIITQIFKYIPVNFCKDVYKNSGTAAIVLKPGKLDQKKVKIFLIYFSLASDIR